jgi:uncharacterized membrane protein
MTLNPWDIRAALFARHAQHVVLIHFPIALFLAGVALDAAASLTRRKDLAVAAYYNLAFAALCALPAAATGLLAWQWDLEGRRLKGILLFHLLSGGAALVLMLAVWRVHVIARRRPDQPFPAFRWPLQAVAVALVMLTGHLGGFLSGVNHP